VNRIHLTPGKAHLQDFVMMATKFEFHNKMEFLDQLNKYQTAQV
jgi:hypothetical protein